MTKQEILLEVIIMRDLWQLGIENRSYNFLYDNNIEIGFCIYILEKNNLDNSLLLELRKEKINRNYMFYYAVVRPRYFLFYNYNFNVIIEKQLQPRLDHLNRTIARLEKEIATENNLTPNFSEKPNIVISSNTIYSLENHKEYLNNQLAQIDSLTQYSEKTREEIKTSLFSVLDELDLHLAKEIETKPTQL